MSESFVHKNGLIYTNDLMTVIGVDTDSSEFTGKVPFGPKIINEEAFSECSVEEISLPDSVEEMPPALFENSMELKTVKLPSSLRELPPYLFSGCSSLTKVVMPDGIRIFPEGLFYGCSSLTEIPFREGIQVIPENAFTGCSSLKSLILPNTVTTIGPGAFKDCKGLETIVISAKLFELAQDAFEGCDSIRSIRVDQDNHLFYIGDDGCLYEKNVELDGDDICRLKVTERKESENSFVEEIAEENDEAQTFVSTEESDDDDTFSAEIDASEEEKNSIDEQNQTIDNNGEEEKMENQNDVDALFADIMGEEKARTSDAVETVGVSDEEVEVLSQTMEVMAESSNSSSVAVSVEELENLFASHEAEVTAENESNEDSAFDKKTQILINSVDYNKVLENETINPREDGDLFVVAENLIEDDEGNKDFSPKLIACVEKIARIQDFSRVIMLKGLPLDNEEFMQFYFHFINKRNVILATSAEGTSTLSDYGKKICEQSRISLTKDDLAEQRKIISIKNDSLIKLVVQDLYN